MTGPYNLDDDEVLFERPRTDAWIKRVRGADAEAEARWRAIEGYADYAPEPDQYIARTLIAIAAELRAARIARRPGAGQNYNDIPGAGQRGC